MQKSSRRSLLSGSIIGLNGLKYETIVHYKMGDFSRKGAKGTCEKER